MKKLISLLLALVLAVSLFAGCTKTPAPVETPEINVENTETPEITTPDVEIPAAPASFTDSVGRTVEVPANITKISPSGALAQMFLIAIAPDLLCTVASDYGEYDAQYIPAEVLNLPTVGQFYGSDNLNYESIAALGTEIVIDVGEPKNTIVEDMDSITTNLAIPAVHITATLNSAPDAFRMLGTLLDREAKGEELALYCERILGSVTAMMNDVQMKPSALYLLGDAGLNVLAATSFHSEVIDYMTNNLAVVDSPASRGTGNETDLEQISLWNPEFILFASDVNVAAIEADPTWQQLDAIKYGMYYVVPSGPYNWMGTPPAINRYLGMIWMTYVLYTNDDVTFTADVIEYYKLFYGYELTEAQALAFIGK